MSKIRHIKDNGSFRSRLAYLAFMGAILDIIFWTLYLTGIITLSEPGDMVVGGFESAFLGADCVLAIALLVTGIGQLHGKAYGDLFLVIASSMALYLGILDITFYAKHGMYSPLSFSNTFEIFINFTCIVGGFLGLIFGGMIFKKDCENSRIARG